MNLRTAETLTRLTDAFYRAQAASFSSTRKSPWRGWERCARFLVPSAPDDGAPVRVLDVGCGNLRFERYLAADFPYVPWEIYAVDNCRALLADQALASGAQVHFQELDIMPALLRGAGALERVLQAPPCDAAVCFGVMHHVPTFAARAELLRTLVSGVRAGGTVCVSLWRFMANEGMAQRVRALQPRAREDAGLAAADLERNDYLLGWNAQPGVYRYCHHFDDGEVDRLADAVSDKARVVDRFTADGRSGNLNAYIVLRVE